MLDAKSRECIAPVNILISFTFSSFVLMKRFFNDDDKEEKGDDDDDELLYSAITDMMLSTFLVFKA